MCTPRSHISQRRNIKGNNFTFPACEGVHIGLLPSLRAPFSFYRNPGRGAGPRFIFVLLHPPAAKRLSISKNSEVGVDPVIRIIIYFVGRRKGTLPGT